jgi:diacylglycerol kinase (ATP)
MIRSDARVIVLVNPSARRAGRHGWVSGVAVLKSRVEVDVYHPESAAAMIEEARDGVRRGVAAVVVAGGDGSVNCVASALAGSPVPLGLLPLGTGNDFARAMRVPCSGDDAARQILEGRIAEVDLAQVNGRYFCTAGVLGVPADAALTVRRWLSPAAATRPLLHVLGHSCYTLAGLRHLLRPHSLASRYVIEPAPGPGEAASPLTLRSPGVFVANTRVLGGGLVLPIAADHADGQLDIAVIRDISRARLLWAFVCLARGWRIPDGVLDVVRTAEAVIRCEGRRPFAADGDFMGDGEQFTVRAVPRALRVIGVGNPRT